MSESASDEMLKYIESEGYTPDADDIPNLIARIHAETEARKAAESEAAIAYDEMHHWRACTQSAEELARSIRHTTIQECAAIVLKRRDEIWAAQDGNNYSVDLNLRLMAVPLYEINDTILALLERKP